MKKPQLRIDNKEYCQALFGVIGISASALTEKVLQGLLLFSNIERVQLIGESYWYIWAEDVTEHIRSQLIALGWWLEERDGCEFVWIYNF